jgi:DNA-binding NarL/FixJ family response regulator
VILTDGRTYRSAAAALGIATSAVKTMTSTVYHRLGVSGLVACSHGSVAGQR